jgi:hypothetical protein
MCNLFIVGQIITRIIVIIEWIGVISGYYTTFYLISKMYTAIFHGDLTDKIICISILIILTSIINICWFLNEYRINKKYLYKN